MQLQRSCCGTLRWLIFFSLGSLVSSLIEIVFPRRLHRLAYFLRLIIANILSSFLYTDRDTMNASIWWIVVIALALYGLFFILLPRLRDVGMSTWWLLVALVPLVNILLGIILLFRAPEYHFGSSTNEIQKT